MSKHYQESEIEFRRDEPESQIPKYPVARGLIIHQYGGDVEECIKKARKEFILGTEWKVISFKDAEV